MNIKQKCDTCRSAPSQRWIFHIFFRKIDSFVVYVSPSSHIPCRQCLPATKNLVITRSKTFLMKYGPAKSANFVLCRYNGKLATRKKKKKKRDHGINFLDGFYIQPWLNPTVFEMAVYGNLCVEVCHVLALRVTPRRQRRLTHSCLRFREPLWDSV